MPAPRYFNTERQRPEADRTIRAPRVMLVEGPDDIYFFDALLAQLGADPSQCQVIDYGGKDRVSAITRLLVRDPMFANDEIHTLAIVQDADGNYGAAETRIMEAFKVAGLVAPPLGSFAGNSPRLGSFVLPDNASAGDLDSMLYSTVSGTDAFKAVEDLAIALDFEQLGQGGKRRSQCYLAAQADLCRGAGRGAILGYFDLNSKTVDPVRNFVRDFMS